MESFQLWHVMVEMPDGQCRRAEQTQERFDPDKFLPKDAKNMQDALALDSQGASPVTGRSEPYKWNGRTFPCAAKIGNGPYRRMDLDRLGGNGQAGCVGGPKFPDVEAV